ncbi:hypothetical protein [Nonomuraea sp. NPDC049784]|uniref:hypothetical protein n=1 Tax=Nonomuraea sp. NPDC049784 TaxID=3154361 RepID=UPI0033E82177
MMAFQRSSGPADKVTKGHVRHVISLARKLPEHQPLFSGDAHFQIAHLRRGVILRRTSERDALEALKELTGGGERIAVVQADVFHLFCLTPWIWWVDKRRHNLPVEGSDEDTLRVIAVPSNSKGLTAQSIQLLCGRHVFNGVTADDLSVLARQLRRAAPVE